MIHALEIAGLPLHSNVLLAPLAGYTNYPFRKLCAELGAALTFTEMVSAKGLMYGSEETKLLLYHEGEHPRAAQIFGSDPAIMRAACESEALAGYDLIDINMGCPMPKIVKNGDGSALLENLPLAARVISACAQTSRRISVKIRIGVDGAHKNAAGIARMCEDAGACMITVHGRTRDMIYAGEPDYDQIAAAKRAVRIPVIANGGVWNRADMDKMLERTGADGVMIARAALYRPQIFCDIPGREAPSMRTVFFEQFERTLSLYGPRFAVVFMRKMAALYCKGLRGATEYRRRLFAVTTPEALRALAAEIFQEE